MDGCYAGEVVREWEVGNAGAGGVGHDAGGAVDGLEGSGGF